MPFAFSVEPAILSIVWNQPRSLNGPRFISSNSFEFLNVSVYPIPMAEENESSSGRKRRVIHWNPDAGREQISRRWMWKRIVGWSVGGFFALLFTAGIVIRVAK